MWRRRLEDFRMVLTLPIISWLDEIGKLEITPAQLALEPCSAGCVITDPNTGEVLACVSYPGYDNNRLTNTMDSAYFASLNLDHSSPLYSKATQQQTAPGSTFKPVPRWLDWKRGLSRHLSLFMRQVSSQMPMVLRPAGFITSIHGSSWKY